MPGQERSRLAGKMYENLSKKLADEPAIQRTVESLAAWKMEAIVVESRDKALEALIELVPPVRGVLQHIRDPGYYRLPNIFARKP